MSSLTESQSQSVSLPSKTPCKKKNRQGKCKRATCLRCPVPAVLGASFIMSDIDATTPVTPTTAGAFSIPVCGTGLGVAPFNVVTTSNGTVIPQGVAPNFTGLAVTRPGLLNVAGTFALNVTGTSDFPRGFLVFVPANGTASTVPNIPLAIVGQEVGGTLMYAVPASAFNIAATTPGTFQVAFCSTAPETGVLVQGSVLSIIQRPFPVVSDADSGAVTLVCPKDGRGYVINNTPTPSPVDSGCAGGCYGNVTGLYSGNPFFGQAQQQQQAQAHVSSCCVPSRPHKRVCSVQGCNCGSSLSS